MESSKKQLALELYDQLPNKNITGMLNVPSGANIREIEGVPGDHGPYIKEEYANFIVYIINNFEEIMGGTDE